MFLRIERQSLIIEEAPTGERTYLEVDDDEDNNDGGDEVADVGRVLAVKGLLQRVELVLLGEQEVEQRDDGTFELGTLLRADCDRRERFPQDDLANVGGDEERDSASETVAFLEEFVEEDDDDAGEGELEDDEAAVEGADLVHGAVHARQEVG